MAENDIEDPENDIEDQENISDEEDNKYSTTSPNTSDSRYANIRF